MLNPQVIKELEQYKDQKVIFLMVGNIGSGKSTYAKKLRQYMPNTYIACMDGLRYSIAGQGEYLFDLKTEPAVYGATKHLVYEFMVHDCNIIVDEVLFTHKRRKPYIVMAKEFDYKVIAIEFPDLGKELAVKRRLNNPHGQPDPELWAKVYDKFHNGTPIDKKKEGIDLVIKLTKSDIMG